jgi:hypothetical protein
VSFPFDLHSAAVFGSHIPWHGMCESALCVKQTRPHCVNQMGKPLADRHGMCESALCVNQTRPHCVNQMGKPLADRHGMCESAFIL